MTIDSAAAAVGYGAHIRAVVALPDSESLPPPPTPAFASPFPKLQCIWSRVVSESSQLLG
jgi:hypothetical protein